MIINFSSNKGKMCFLDLAKKYLSLQIGLQLDAKRYNEDGFMKCCNYFDIMFNLFYGMNTRLYLIFLSVENIYLSIRNFSHIIHISYYERIFSRKY